MYKEHEWQMCYDCGKSIGGCSWTDRFEPVDGWDAVKTHKARGCGKYQDVIDSYDILYCPEFVPDKPVAPASLDFDGCISLVCAIFRGAAQEYVDALGYFDEVRENYSEKSPTYTLAKNRLKCAENALTPEVCATIRRRYNEGKGNNDG